MLFLLDACAVIALLREEDGANEVERIIVEEDCFIASINVYEVYKESYLQNGTFEPADRVLQRLADADVRIWSNMDDTVLRRSAELKVTYRIAIPDCFGLAIAESLGGSFVTSDHKELGTLQTLGFPIQFFRPPPHVA